jgi:hypothetical protein
MAEERHRTFENRLGLYKVKFQVLAARVVRKEERKNVRRVNSIFNIDGKRA